MNQKGFKLALLGSLGSAAPSIGSSIGPIQESLDLSVPNLSTNQEISADIETDLATKDLSHDVSQDLSQTPTVRAFRAKRYIEQWFTKNCNFHIEDDNAIR